MCLQHPGAVFNIACKLGGAAPLQAIAEPAVAGNARLLELVSRDQGISASFESWDHLYTQLLRDAGAGGKRGRSAGGVDGPAARSISHESSVAVHAACVAVLMDSNLSWRLGLVDSCGPQTQFPAGLRVTTASLLPKGSGLGGSSILALACVRAVAGACEQELSHDDEMNAVLAVEQALGTGGGWQDQIGATPGLKLTVRELGLGGRFAVSRVALSREHLSLLERRFVCIGTAITRVAKTVLVGVVDQYCYGAAAPVDILVRQLVANAHAMHAAMELFASRAVSDAPGLEDALVRIGMQSL